MKKTAVVTAAVASVGVVVRRVLSISLVMGVIMALAGNVAWGETGISLVKNGSFENDGPIWDINIDAPRYWCDVNVPADKFVGYVDDYWQTNGDYCLTIQVQPVETEAADIAMVSQEVYLADVSEIIFDVKLSSAHSSFPWDSQIRSALVLIDGNDFWDSNDFQPNEEDEYLNQKIDVSGIFDEYLHVLSLAVRTNVNDEPFVEYYADWDFIKFDTYCSGLGFRAEDFDHDCHVGLKDLGMLVGQWLVEDSNLNCAYDLVEDGIVNFRDFNIFANYWINNHYWENWQPAKCYQMQQLLDSDLDDSGEVNNFDLDALVDNWLNEGSCIKADLNEDGIVNFQDFAILANQWLQRSWLYGL